VSEITANERVFQGILWNKINEILKEKISFHLEIKGTTITLPRSPEDCNKVLRTLKHDFEKYSSQIKAMLKTYRSKAHYISIYRNLVIIELDGIYHQYRLKEDEERTKILNYLGLKVIRFSNDEIINDLNGEFTRLKNF